MLRNRHARTLMLACAATLTATVSRAAAPDPKAWTVDDVVLAERASSWAVSPDGTLAAWVRATVEKVGGEEQRVSNLWLSRLTDGTSVPLTRGQETTKRRAVTEEYSGRSKPV